MTHGGKRKGAGRQPGDPDLSARAELHGLTLWDFYLRPVAPPQTRRDMIKIRVDDINTDLGTGYTQRDVDNWIAGRRKTPVAVLNLMRRHYLLYAFGDRDGQALITMLDV